MQVLEVEEEKAGGGSSNLQLKKGYFFFRMFQIKGDSCWTVVWPHGGVNFYLPCVENGNNQTNK